MADYLESYVRALRPAGPTGVRIDRLSRHGDGFVLQASGRSTLFADRVVIATGALPGPVRPGFAARTGPSIRQLHSVEYRNPSQLPTATC